MDELKPCPFCGSEGLGLKHAPRYWLEGNGVYWMACSDCGATGSEGRTEALAIEAWNTRAERTCRYVEDPDTGFELCSECGAPAIEDWTADYCRACGAKVVG